MFRPGTNHPELAQTPPTESTVPNESIPTSDASHQWGLQATILLLLLQIWGLLQCLWLGDSLE